MALLYGFQQGGAQGRRKHQGDNDGQHHRRDDGNRELAVNHARRTAEEGHRHEHGRQHHGDTDQRARDLRHGLARRFQRRQALFAHHALDVFHHHDRVIDQETDGQHHGEHGQRIDRIAEGVQDAEGTEQHDRHGHGRDQGGAEVLQEQIHHQEHQDDRFDQGLDHFFDGQFHERGRVERHLVAHAFRELLAQVAEHGLRRVGRVERVGTRRQLDRHAGGRMAVVAGHGVVVFAAQFHGGHVLQVHHGTVGRGFQQDGAELFHRLQAALRRYRGVQLLALDGRRAAQFTGRHFRILRLHGRDHVRRCQVKTLQLGRIEPDTHGVLRTEQGHVAHARHAAERIDDVGGHIVAQVGLVHLAVFGNEAEHHQEVLRRFRHDQALLRDSRRQQWRGQLQLVLYLHLSNVRIRATGKRQGDADAASGIARRGHVAQAVDPLHLLFDDLGNRVFHGLGGGARVGAADRNRRRSNARVLRDRQAEDRNHAGKHDDDRDHPGKNRAVNEKTGH